MHRMLCHRRCTHCLTPRWSQRRLLLHFTVFSKFTLAVFRAVAQLGDVRRIYAYEPQKASDARIDVDGSSSCCRHCHSGTHWPSFGVTFHSHGFRFTECDCHRQRDSFSLEIRRSFGSSFCHRSDLQRMADTQATTDYSMSHPPNKSPEPTAVGAVSSAIAVHVASRRWLSFFR